MRPQRKRPPLATPGPPFLCKEPCTQNTGRMGPWLSTYWPHRQPQLRHACPDPPSPPLLICPRPMARKPFLQASPQPPGRWPPSAARAALCGAPAQPSDLRELGETLKPQRVFPSFQIQGLKAPAIPTITKEPKDLPVWSPAAVPGPEPDCPSPGPEQARPVQRLTRGQLSIFIHRMPQRLQDLETVNCNGSQKARAQQGLGRVETDTKSPC